MKLKQIISAALCLVLVFALFTGCSPSGANDVGSNDPVNTGAQDNVNDDVSKNDADGNGKYDKVVVGINADPEDFSPWNERSNNRCLMFFGLYDYLFDFVDGEFIPDAGKSIDQSNDNYWDVELFENIYDTDGNHITAHDVAFAYQNYVDSGFAQKFSYYDHMEVLDEYTVRIHWKKPAVELNPVNKVLSYVPIYSKAAWESHNFAVDPCGSGPYTLESYTPGVSIVLKAKDNYWQTDESLISPLRRANVDVLQYDIIPEAAQNVIALKNDAIALSSSVPAENLAEFESDSKFAVSLYESSNYVFVVCNTSDDNICKDINLRKALYYAVNNEAIVKTTSSLYSIDWLPDACADYVDDWHNVKNYFNTYDLELAKEYLAKSSYNGETLSMMLPNSGDFQHIGELLQNFWLELGVNVELNFQSQAITTANMATDGEWDIYCEVGGGTYVVDPLTKLFDKNQWGGEYCIGFIKDDKLQELFEVTAVKATHNDETLTTLYDYIAENVYMYSIGGNCSYIVHSQDITDLYIWSSFVIPNACTYDLG